MMIYRLAAISDAYVIAQHRYPNESGKHLNEYRMWLPTAIQSGHYVGWLAVREVQGVDEVVGGAGLLLLHWGPSRNDASTMRGRIVNVYVEPAVRRQSIAQQLLERTMRTAQSMGVHTLALGTSEMARSLYMGMGFQPSKTEMWRVQQPDS